MIYLLVSMICCIFAENYLEDMKHSDKPYEYQDLGCACVSEPALAYNSHDSLGEFVSHSYKQYQQGQTLSMDEVKNRLDAKWGAL